MMEANVLSCTFFNQVKVSQMRIDQFIVHYSSALSHVWPRVFWRANIKHFRHIDDAVICSLTFSMPSILAIVLLTTAV